MTLGRNTNTWQYIATWYWQCYMSH